MADFPVRSESFSLLSIVVRILLHINLLYYTTKLLMERCDNLQHQFSVKSEHGLFWLVYKRQYVEFFQHCATHEQGNTLFYFISN